MSPRASFTEGALLSFVRKILARKQALDPERKDAAPAIVSGYEAANLIDVVFAKTVALTKNDVPNSTGAERTMLAVLLAARSVETEPLRVLDFGGACGFHYQAASLLNVQLRWAVVESPAMAAKASELQTSCLRFFDNIGDATRWLGGVDLLFSSSALQYVRDQDTTLKKLLALEAPVVVWSRLPMVHGPAITEIQSSRLAHNGPGPMPAGFEDTEVQYTMTHISMESFMAAHVGYTLLFRAGELSSSAFVFSHDRSSKTADMLPSLVPR